MPMSQAQKKQLLKISPQDLQAGTPDGRLMAKGLMQLRQAVYDVMGAFPQDNVEPYQYAFSRTQLKNNRVPANAQVQDNIRISADAAFIATQFLGVSSGNYLCLIRQDASDRQFSNEALHSNALMGTAERPHFLAKPWYLPANTTVSFEVTDLSGAANEVYWNMHGYKIYRR